ncbi:MAG: hypothetical protein IKU00_08835 [Bacteroidales bacterium]|nr:hypothetical protein [Bacteroidales bacterium]
MDKKEAVFQDVLFKFISLLPGCVSEKDGKLEWCQEENDCYGPNYPWTNTKKVLAECGIALSEDFYRGSSHGRPFLYISMNAVNVGDGWISFQGEGISILYDHWDEYDYFEEDNGVKPNGNISRLIILFEQYLKAFDGYFDGLDIGYCLEQFGEVYSSPGKKSISCIDSFLRNFKKYYIFQSHISKANFLRLSKKDSYLRLGANKKGELIWDIHTFVKDTIYFSDCYIDVSNSVFSNGDGFHYDEADRMLSKELYDLLHFEPYNFVKKAREKVLDLVSIITKKDLNLNYGRADDDISNLKKKIIDLVCNKGNLFEIKEYQSRFFPQVIHYLHNDHQVLSFVENASHSSDFSYNKLGDAHRSFLVISKNKLLNVSVITLIPSNNKYSTYGFQVTKGLEQVAIALIVGYFNSCIDNKRENLLIKPLFQDFGITRFQKY